MKRSKWTDWTLIAGFLLCLYLPLIFSLKIPTMASKNRMPTLLKSNTTPAVSELTRQKEFEAYYDENFGFRDNLVILFNYLSVSMGITPRADIMLGSDDWLYLSGKKVLGDVSGEDLFTLEELKLWQRYLTIKHQALKDLGIGYVFVVAPNKQVIHPEHVPEDYRFSPELTRTDQWIETMMRETDVPIVDVRRPLKQAASILPVYKPADTHWSEYGGAIVSSCIINKFRKQGLDRLAIPVHSEKFNMKSLGKADMARMMHLEPLFDSPEPVFKRSEFQFAEERVLKRNTLYVRKESLIETPGAQQRLILMGDSFVHSLENWLAIYFEKTLVLRLHNHQMRHLDPVAHYVENFKPDFIVEIRVGRFLLDTVPENPPLINIERYPRWLKKYFELQTLKK